MSWPQIPHAAERSMAGEGGDADPCIARSCFRARGAGGTWRKLTINSGSRLINIAHNRNFPSIAFNNRPDPDVLNVANRVHLASRRVNAATKRQRLIRKLGRNAAFRHEQFDTDAADRQLHPSWTAPRNDLKRLEVDLRGVSIPRSLGNEIPSPQVNHDRFTTSGHFDQ